MRSVNFDDWNSLLNDSENHSEFILPLSFFYNRPYKKAIDEIEKYQLVLSKIISKRNIKSDIVNIKDIE